MLLIETSRAYGRGLVEGIGRFVEQRGPWSIYYDERGLHDPLPTWLKQWRGDGIIARTVRKTDLKRLRATGLPVVELYAEASVGLPSVFPDHDLVGQMAAEHLLGRGLRHLAFYCADRAFWVERRREAFVRNLAERNCGCEVFAPLTPARGKDRPRILDRQAAAWLRALPKPCGIFCASDLHAARLSNVCRDCGIAVPEQVALLGVDNDQVMCSVSSPSLSSIDLDSRRIGYEAALLLARLMAGKRRIETEVRIEPLTVVTRQSTDTVAVADPEVAHAVRLIREQACRRLRVAEVAATLGLSPRVLQQRFQKALRRTPKQEILHVRMERAKMLLRETDATAESISRQTGFASLQYFSRSFRRETGLTARAYRSEHRQSRPRSSGL
ncbi:MAG: DNA-binding transcriptional regulator [Phycisphaerae bacterium]|nr:DNA-binding transcriptional regulator [Phycisphaerae bacterium]